MDAPFTDRPELLRVLCPGLFNQMVPLPLGIGSAPTEAVWGTANQARYQGFFLSDYYTVKAGWFLTGTCAAKTAYMGIYTVDGTAIWLSGAFTTSSGTINIVTTGGLPIVLPPGSYYLALSFTTTTSTGVFRWTLGRLGMGRLNGALEQASAAPLPATMTPVTPPSSVTPYMGIASITSF
jgi:hypothetical protein